MMSLPEQTELGIEFLKLIWEFFGRFTSVVLGISMGGRGVEDMLNL
jgi:hypothetical protein